MTATFADFLHPASEHITAAVSYSGELPDSARRGVIRHLSRLVSTLARYTADLPLPDEFTPPTRRQQNPKVRAALDARLALRRAAQGLRHGANLIGHGDADDTHPVVRHLSAAADHLAAGRDLLQTHFTTGPSSNRTSSSYWAPAITSEPVTTALPGELASHARTLAPWAARPAISGPLDSDAPAPACLALHTSSQWLWIAGVTVEAAHRHLPPTAQGHQLLNAVPVNSAPPRQPPADNEQLPDLCQGIAVTTERLRHAALTFARQARWSPTTTSLSWKRDALASAITTHASAIILRTLTDRAHQLGLDPAICARLQTAAENMNQPWPVWRAVAHHWDTVSTGIHRGTGPTPIAAEIGDLALRVGRLAYHNPHWTPAFGDTSDTRDPAHLAPSRGGIVSVVAAIHTATDALTRIATEDREAVLMAVDDHRLYVPTLLLPGTLAARTRYRPIRLPQADAILTAYNQAIEATTAATTAVDHLAAAIDAPTTLLSAVRRAPAARTQERSRMPRLQQPTQNRAMPGIGELEQGLRKRQISDPALLARAGALDDAVSELLTEAAATTQNREAISLPAAPRGKSARPSRVGG